MKYSTICFSMNLKNIVKMLQSSICHLDKGTTNANRWVTDGHPPNISININIFWYLSSGQRNNKGKPMSHWWSATKWKQIKTNDRRENDFGWYKRIYSTNLVLSCIISWFNLNEYQGKQISIHCIGFIIIIRQNHHHIASLHSSQKHHSYSSKIVMIMASVRIPRRSSSIRVINESWEKAGRPKHHFSSPRAELILDKNHPFSLSHSASSLDRDDKNMFKCNYDVCKSSH